MLELKDIKKDYVTQSLTTHALKGVTVNFRQNEFVSILGSSGCGKTTLLNIIGGLDRYTSGDLLIKGKSTKDYKARDWDTYRSHSIGFVFQSYNLIMHQTILSNVELALTIAGISKSERKKRAEKALETVGLGGLGSKKPNQLSGGQMQRVAIARAIVNNPEILLADEPTGALDSQTSIQVMDLLKDIAKDRLVIMVTHNPELANQYSTRIIKLKDGQIVDDSMPYTNEEAKKEVYEENDETKSKKKSRMSFGTALQLSFNNLRTKKGRTVITAFAGSIGIIGIGLILALSDGFNNYVNRVQQDSLSTLPIVLKQNDVSLVNIISPQQKRKPEAEAYTKDQTIYTKDFLFDVLTRVVGNGNRNDLKSFKTYLETDEFKTKYGDCYNAIQYVHGTDINLYKEDITTSTGYKKTFDIDYTPLKDLKDFPAIYKPMLSSVSSKQIGVFSLLLNNQKVIDQQYDLLCGNWPTKENEVLIRVDKYNRINDYVYYALGLKDLKEDVAYYNEHEKIKPYSGSFETILGLELKMPLRSNLIYKRSDDNLYHEYDETKEEQAKAKQEAIDNAPKLKIAGIVRGKKEATSGSIASPMVYTDLFVEKMNERVADTEFVKAQLAVEPVLDEETGEYYYPCLLDKSLTGTMEQMRFSSKEQIVDFLSTEWGYGTNDNPYFISIYPKSFAAKDKLKAAIEEYNQKMEKEGHKEKQISYTDNLSNVTQALAIVIDGITYVLIGFVSISLVVSSVMIGIITYVSVIERTKEIGVLRSLGASKGNVGSVFNAETFIIGLTSGALGVGISILGTIPLNFAINSMAKIGSIAYLSWYYALALIAVSVILTCIAGLIPSQVAAKKDPVIALRSGE